MNRRIKIIALIIIFGTGIFLRTWKLDSVPPAPSLDEVTTGWNAYSILKTGADEYGTKFPLLLRAYDDWRPALYVYAVVPFVGLFGLNPVSVRLPSVIVSVITIWLAFKIAELMFAQTGKPGNSAAYIPYAAAAFLALSPWHVYISRLGHEANFGLFFTVFGVYLFLKAVSDKSVRYLTFSAVSFILTLYSYQSEKIVTPVLVIGLLLIFCKQIYGFGRKLIIPTLVAILLIIPVIIVSLSPQGLSRFSGTSAISNNTRIEQAKIKLMQARLVGNLWGRITYSPKIIGIEIIAGNYLSHFQPKWLFTGGFYESFKIPYMGLINLIEIPFILAGLVVLIKGNLDRRYKALLVLWLLSAPLPASVTTGSPHAMRSYTFIPVWQFFAACGFGAIIRLIKSTKVVKTFVFLTGIGMAATLVFMWRNYFTDFPKLQSESFQYALNQALPDVIATDHDFDHIIVSNQADGYQSYMFYLFQAKFDPVLYQKSGGTVSGGYAQTHRIGKYEFRPVVWEKDRNLKNTLLVAATAEIPESAPIYKTYDYLDGKMGVKLVKLK